VGDTRNGVTVMMSIFASWILRDPKHKLILTGTYTGDVWYVPGQATCLLHCVECDKWWPMVKFFNRHSEAISEFKIRAENLHGTE
jgi:hypothetical protein